MAELIALLTIIVVSLLIVRAGGLALVRTGLSIESSMFQSQSAFMGVGFTTSEAEAIVTHPVRRRIVRVLMLLGFASISGTLSTIVITFTQTDEAATRPYRAGLFLLGVIVIWFGWKIRPLERLLDRVISSALETMTDLQIHDYEELLHANKGYSIAKVQIDPGGWMAGRTLRDLQLAEEGILVLSVTRESGVVLGTPASTTTISLGDQLLCYGLADDIAALCNRQAGEIGEEIHERAKRRQRLRLVEERAQDREAEQAEPPEEAP